MNSLAQALIFAGIRKQADLPEEEEAPVRKPRALVGRETVFDGGGRVLEFNSNGAVWNQELQTVASGRYVRPEGGGSGEFVNLVLHGSVESKVGQKFKCFFQIDRITFDDESVFYEVVLRPTAFVHKVDTRIIVGPKKYSESDIQLATGGFIAVVDLPPPATTA